MPLHQVRFIPLSADAHPSISPPAATCGRRVCPSRSLAFLFSLLIAAPCPADEARDVPADLSSVDWQQCVYPLDLTDGRLSGPAADLILERAGNCQFLLFGEQHGVAGLPEVVAAAYSLTQPLGFEYLVTERGPWICERLSQHGVAPTLQQFPHAVAFDYDGEVRLLGHVQSRFAGKGDAFWGVDQSLTAIHGLQRLAEILPSHAGRRAANGLFLRDALQGGRFLSRDNSADLVTLRALAGDAISDEAVTILDALSKSQTIFVAYHNNERDERGIGVSDIVREQYMIDQFDACLRTATEQSEKPPRAIVKMGGAHIMEGVGPNGVRTLGDHIQHVAESNALDALHIAIRSYSENSVWPKSVFKDSEMVLIDTRPLRTLMRDQSADESAARLLRDIEQYDAVLLLRSAGPDTSLEMKRLEADFKWSLLKRVGLIILPLLTTLSLLIPLGRRLWSMASRSGSGEAVLVPFFPWAFISLLSVTIMTIIVVQVLRIRNWSVPQMSRLADRPMLAFLELLCVIVSICLCGLMIRRTWWSRPARIQFAVASGGLIAMAVFAHWWNLGRMLG